MEAIMLGFIKDLCCLSGMQLPLATAFGSLKKPKEQNPVS